jgi:uncharacterized protein YndB with AHSA1/START domain
VAVGHLAVVVDIDAPVPVVWEALTVPSRVSVWDGVEPEDVPAGYPAPGQHARWRTRLGPLRLTLHDRVGDVVPGRRLASVIDVAFVHVEERYTLAETAGGTRVTSDNTVSSSVPGLSSLAHRLTRANVAASMARLKAYCERR